MKKFMSLAVAAVVFLSLSACRTGDVGMEDRNNGVTDGGTNIGRSAGFNNNNNAYANYRDGVYTGYGNTNANGNERAVVTIRNGRIVDIDLDRISQQEGANIGNAQGTSLNSRSRNVTGTGMNNLDGYNNQARNNVYIKTGTVTGTGNGRNRTTGNGTGLGINNTTGTGMNNAIGNGINNTAGTGTGINNTPGAGVGRAIGNAAGVAGDAINQVRTNLVNAIMLNQRADVTIQNNDANAATAADNWKLAVQRALDKARR